MLAMEAPVIEAQVGEQRARLPGRRQDQRATVPDDGEFAEESEFQAAHRVMYVLEWRHYRTAGTGFTSARPCPAGGASAAILSIGGITARVAPTEGSAAVRRPFRRVTGRKKPRSFPRWLQRSDPTILPGIATFRGSRGHQWRSTAASWGRSATRRSCVFRGSLPRGSTCT